MSINLLGYNFINMFLQYFIITILIAGIVFLYGLKDKTIRPRPVVVEFSAPDGSRRAAPLEIGYSWTVLVFRGWALLFRGQFIEWLILFFFGSFLSSMAVMALVGFDPSLLGTGNGASYVPHTLSELFASATTLGIVGYFAFALLHIGLISYYVIVANKNRLRAMYNRGFRFDNPRNGNTEEIYQYIGMMKPKPQSELEPNVRQGASHTYVVPEKPVAEEEEDDYSGLAVADLKLLLRSEGIQFDPTASKDELLELVNEHLVENKKKEVEDYTKLTVNDLKLLMKDEGIIFPSTATKAQLLEMLNEHFKAKK